MKRLREILDRLWRHRPTPDTADGPPATVPEAFSSVLYSDGIRRDRAARTVAQLMKKVRLDERTALYESCSHFPITSRHVRALASFEPDVAAELLGVASLNRSGYVRQAALEELASLATPRALPYILLRLGDWVPQVRAAADLALTGILRPDLAPALLDQRRLIDAMARVERVDLSGVRQRIFTFLLRRECRAELDKQLVSPDQEMRLFGYRVFGEELAARANIIERAVNDPHLGIRRWITRYILDAEPPEMLKWLEVLLRDSCARIRTDIIRRIPGDMLPAFREVIQEQIFADSPSLRSAARFLLRQHGRTDFSAQYRNRIRQADLQDVQPGWIAGLGETGQESDLDLVESHVSHSRPRVRAAAIRAAVRLNRPRTIGHAVKALDDSSGKVRRVAVSVLVAEHSPQTSGQARYVLRHGSPKGQLAALKVLANRSGWEALPDVLTALAVGDERLCAFAWARLAKWYTRHFREGWIKPDPDLLKHIELKIKAMADVCIIPPPRVAIWADLNNLVQEGKKLWREDTG